MCCPRGAAPPLGSALTAPGRHGRLAWLRPANSADVGDGTRAKHLDLRWHGDCQVNHHMAQANVLPPRKSIIPMNASFFSTVAALLSLGLAVSTGACAAPAGDSDVLDSDSDRAEAIGTATSAQRIGHTSPSGACSVISGANSGKSGTYNADGDCAGSWGMSECTNQDGSDSGKCKAGKVIVRLPPVYTPSAASSLLSPVTQKKWND